MFLKDFTLEEAQAFLELAHMMASSDGEMAGVEANMIGFFRIELALAWEDYPLQGLTIEEAAAAFTNDRARRAALMELMLVVMADGVAHPGENALLAEINAAFGLDADTFERQFAWVQRMMAHAAAGARMIEVGDPYAAV